MLQSETTHTRWISNHQPQTQNTKLRTPKPKTPNSKTQAPSYIKPARHCDKYTCLNSWQRWRHDNYCKHVWELFSSLVQNRREGFLKLPERQQFGHNTGSLRGHCFDLLLPNLCTSCDDGFKRDLVLRRNTKTWQTLWGTKFQVNQKRVSNNKLSTKFRFSSKVHVSIKNWHVQEQNSTKIVAFIKKPKSHQKAQVSKTHMTKHLCQNLKLRQDTRCHSNPCFIEESSFHGKKKKVIKKWNLNGKKQYYYNLSFKKTSEQKKRSVTYLLGVDLREVFF